MSDYTGPMCPNCGYQALFDIKATIRGIELRQRFLRVGSR